MHASSTGTALPPRRSPSRTYDSVWRENLVYRRSFALISIASSDRLGIFVREGADVTSTCRDSWC